MISKSLSIGLIGAGSMGKGLFRQIAKTPGMNCVALADIHIEKAISCAKEWGQDYEIVNSSASLQDALHRGVLALCEEGNLIAAAEGIDLLLEASSSILEAGVFCETALKQQKHVVMMNAEADLIFGPYFLEIAQRHQVTYTSCDGDQHGVLARLIDETILWGFDLVVAGNIKGFLDPYANPTTIIPEADKRNLDYKMATAYTDGSKLSIEMALLANGYNLQTDLPGMRGPSAKHVSEALRLFDLERIWESKRPIVDYILGAEPGGGVFVIGRTDDPFQQSMMRYYKMGNGPFYLFYRPYHLCHIEAMRCIREAAFECKALLHPRYGLQTNVFAYAKRDLREGEVLDGLGGYCTYGMIENAIASSGLPICLSEGAILKRNIERDEKIQWSDVITDPLRSDFCLFQKAHHAIMISS